MSPNDATEVKALEQWLEDRKQTVNHYITEADTEMESEYWRGQYDLAKMLQIKVEDGVFDDG